MEHFVPGPPDQVIGGDSLAAARTLGSKSPVKKEFNVRDIHSLGYFCLKNKILNLKNYSLFLQNIDCSSNKLNT